jgi:tetratricopeptide (TPR) repeat protein
MDNKTYYSSTSLTKMGRLTEEEIKRNQDMITLSSLISEADIFLRQTNYKRAEEMYTAALKIDPQNQHILLNRSQCRVIIGDNHGSDADANSLLQTDPKNLKAILCKANALFALGDFEMAMVTLINKVWYTRGKRIKSEVGFMQGEHRCRESIVKAIENFNPKKLIKFLKQNNNAMKTHSENVHEKKANHPDESVKVLIRQDLKDIKVLKINHNLLEENFEDYLFLRKLEKDDNFDDLEVEDGTLKTNVVGSVNYLEQRLEFWRSRNPKGTHEKTVIDQVIRHKALIRDNKLISTQILSKQKVLPKIKA